MPKQLTREELLRALSGLSREEKSELLELLELREQNKREPIAGPCPPLWRTFPKGGTAAELDEYVRAAGHDPNKLPDGPVARELSAKFERDQHAKESSDPDAFRAAWDAYRDAVERHLEALEAELPPLPPSPPGRPTLEEMFRVSLMRGGGVSTAS